MMRLSTPNPLRTEELDFDLPLDRIATRPAEPRDSARMLVMWRSRDAIEHRLVRDLSEYLNAGDALVFNNTAVTPARLIGRRAETGGKVEGLFLHELEGEAASHGEPLRWLVMLKAGGKLKPGMRVALIDHHQQPTKFELELIEQQAGGEWEAHVRNGEATQAALDAVGWTPLPPYILNARESQARRGGSGAIDSESQDRVQIQDQDQVQDQDDLDRVWYQTTFADFQRRKSVAAPTAGLHFTPGLLAAIEEKGVRRLEVTLHVGAGTFKPVTAATLDQHRMHAEWFEAPSETIAALSGMRREPRRGRVIAVGTTAVRTLESLPRPLPNCEAEICGPIAGMTDLLIAPPYEFALVDGMLTNFHLPRSTLLALVAAMAGGSERDGLTRIKAVYREAIERGYRFYSYGDAMLILP